jgi:hypothetical protein
LICILLKFEAPISLSGPYLLLSVFSLCNVTVKARNLANWLDISHFGQLIQPNRKILMGKGRDRKVVKNISLEYLHVYQSKGLESLI